MQSVSRVLFLLGLPFLLLACAQVKPDEPIRESPRAAEEAEEQTLTPVAVPTMRADEASPSPIYGLLPATSHIAIALVPRALDEESGETIMFGEQGFAAMPGGPAMMQDLLGPEGVELIDRGQRQLMAMTTASYEELLSRLRAGAPLMSLDDLPRGIHVRSIIPTDAADELAEALIARCVARSESGVCEEFLETEATPYALVVDWLLGEDNLRDGPTGRSLAGAFAVSNQHASNGLGVWRLHREGPSPGREFARLLAWRDGPSR